MKKKCMLEVAKRINSLHSIGLALQELVKELQLRLLTTEFQLTEIVTKDITTEKAIR
jgi:hypothetical protein